MIPRARRLEQVRGFGIDRVAAAADRPAQANPDWPVLRMENLDTDLPLPPEALRVTDTTPVGAMATVIERAPPLSVTMPRPPPAPVEVAPATPAEPLPTTTRFGS